MCVYVSVFIDMLYPHSSTGTATIPLQLVILQPQEKPLVIQLLPYSSKLLVANKPAFVQVVHLLAENPQKFITSPMISLALPLALKVTRSAMVMKMSGQQNQYQNLRRVKAVNMTQTTSLYLGKIDLFRK